MTILIEMHTLRGGHYPLKAYLGFDLMLIKVKTQIRSLVGDYNFNIALTKSFDKGFGCVGISDENINICNGSETD